MIKEKQVHVLIGCADARDLNQIQLDAVATTSTAFRPINLVDFVSLS
jgi:hypothetical protein